MVDLAPTRMVFGLKRSDRWAHSFRGRWIVRKTVIVFVIIALFLIFVISTAQAQRTGFITGIVPMSNPVAPMRNPLTPFVHSPFVSGFPAQAPVIVRTPRVFLNTGLVTPFADPFIHQQLHTFGFSHVHVIPHTFPTVIFRGGVVARGPGFVAPGRRFRSPRIFVSGHRRFRR